MQTISRTTIFEKKPVIRAHIRGFQGDLFDPDYDNPGFDAMGFEQQELRTGHAIVMFHHPEINTYAASLTAAIQRVLETLGCQDLVVMAMTRIDWFGNQTHTDAPLVRVRKRFAASIAAGTFDEALVITKRELPDLVDFAFWSSRLDPDFPEYFFFMDRDERFAFFLCRYGNVHFCSLGSDGLVTDSDFWQRHGFVDDADFDQFAER